MKRIICFILVLLMLVPLSYTVSTSAPPTVSKENRLPFKDVKDGSWYKGGVEFCYVNGIVSGMNKDEFRPSSTLTRASLVTMIANLENADVSGYAVNKFTDVKSSHWYYRVIGWAYEEGIVSGMSETEFSPNSPLTRAQFAVILKNYMEDRYNVVVDYGVIDVFTDKPKTSYWYYEAMVYAVSAGLISGMTESTLGASGTVTRAQACRVFMLLLQNYVYSGHGHVYEAADCVSRPVCRQCGLVGGMPSGHLIKDYDCINGGICTVCGASVESEVYEHSFSPATCISPMTCTVCGYVEGERLEHDFSEATCAKPETCTMCGLTRGSAYGHKIGTFCVYCQNIIYEIPYDKIKCQIQMYGVLDADLRLNYLSKEGKNTKTWLIHYMDEDKVTLKNVYYFDKNGNYEVVELEIPRSGACNYKYWYLEGYEYVFEGYGILDPDTFTKNTSEAFDRHEGTYYPQYTENINIALRQIVSDADSILRYWCDYCIADLGFKAF